MPEGERADHLRNRVFCSSCGVAAARRNGAAPLGWQELSDFSSRTLAMCPDCVRRSLWLIEARLDLDPGSGL